MVVDAVLVDSGEWRRISPGSITMNQVDEMVRQQSPLNHTM